ncbi:restriction endonuclease subunit S [Nostoc sp. FACHB-280]|uniref:restriction endonuclease subunit S n=1 Tax=Nostoc sp. FACHB-280 TaxID=2692839 RepID=UPI00168AD236|nr:restriction endonuclease subunit S [Nostoc sp. FACHB-280]MBD2495461.1 restriction endonuclease subunit S [Nostoc sp. FACHB-280]
MTWKKATLGQIADEVGGSIQTGPFGSQLHQSDYQSYGIPVIMPQNIVNDKITEDSIAYVDDVMVHKLSRHVLQVGDIVYPRRGELNKRAIITERESGWLCGTGCVKISLPNSHLVPSFLFYYLKQSQVVKWIENKAVGSTMLNLNTGILRSLEVQYPNYQTQQRIAEILSNYDRLIDNNNRRIGLLEESIHLLYKEWFMRLRFPCYESVKVVDGIPEGWKYTTLSEIAQINEQSISKKNPPEQIKYVDISSVTTGSINATQSIKFGDAPSRAQRIVKHGDIIWSMVRPGRKAYALVLNPPENLVVSTGFAVISTKDIPFTFLYKAVTTDSFVSHMEQVATGAAYPAVKPKDFECMTLLIPQDKIVRQFDSFVLPIFKQIYTLQSQNKSFQQARDLLIPRLMNGSIAV